MRRPVRLAVIGGTFNPPHFGHVRIAQDVLALTDYEMVLFVPTNVPAHKALDVSTATHHRMRMVELLCRLDDKFAYDFCEIKRGGVTYSIDTAKEIRSRYALDGKPGFVVGDDLIDGFDKWYRVDEFVELVDLVIVRRRSVHEFPFARPHRLLNNRIVEISSSTVRARVRRGEPITGLVPRAIEDYIHEHALYVE